MGSNKFASFINGFVKDIKDPDKENKVQVSIPQLEIVTPYIPVLSFLASKEYGAVCIPNVGDKVLVLYSGRNFDDAYVLGCIYDGVDKPKLIIDDKNDKVQIITKGQTTILMDETKDKQKISLKTSKDIELQIDNENEVINVTDKDKKTFLKIDMKNGEVAITAKKKISFTANQDTMVLEDGKGLTLNSKQGALTVSAKDVKLEAQANWSGKGNSGATLEGAKIDIKAQGQLNAQATGTAAFKGNMTQIG